MYGFPSGAIAGKVSAAGDGSLWFGALIQACVLAPSKTAKAHPRSLHIHVFLATASPCPQAQAVGFPNSPSSVLVAIRPSNPITIGKHALPSVQISSLQVVPKPHSLSCLQDIQVAPSIASLNAFFTLFLDQACKQSFERVNQRTTDVSA